MIPSIPSKVINISVIVTYFEKWHMHLPSTLVPYFYNYFRGEKIFCHQVDRFYHYIQSGPAARVESIT